MIDTQKFREIKNKHAKIEGTEGLLFEKLEVVESDTGSYAYLNECIADGNAANFKGLKESSESEYIEPGENTYIIDYNSALISFSENFTIPTTLYAEYWGGGSIIWADDVSSLQEACRTIDNNAIYKDGSVALEGDLNLNGNNIKNANLINGVSIRNHKHLGTDVDGTVQLDDDSISSLSISKITNLQSTLNNKQDKLPAYQSGKYLTNNGSSLSWGSATSRNIGEVVQSMLPLNDPKLHLLNGDLVSTTAYPDLNNYILTNSLVTQYPSGVEIIGNLQNSNHVLSGFSSSNYAQIPITFVPVNNEWEIRIKFKYVKQSGSQISYQNLISPASTGQSSFAMELYVRTEPNRNFVTLNIFSNWNPNGSSSSISFSGSTSLVDGADYFIKVGYSNSQLYIKLSNDNEITYTLVASRSASSLVYLQFNLSFLNFGVSWNKVNPWLGSIDLKECYIKVNNDILWAGGSTYSIADADFLLDEGIWQSYKYKYGVCGKFVYDYANKTIRLPKANCILQGSIADYSVGNIVEAGLPNIIGNGWVQYGINGSDWAGAFKASNITGKADQASGTAVGQGTLAFNASWSNPIYGKSNTVQPQTIKALNYMVVAK